MSLCDVLLTLEQAITATMPLNIQNTINEEQKVRKAQPMGTRTGICSVDDNL